MNIRPYKEEDAEAVYRLHEHAFDGLDEAGLVAKIHDDGADVLSVIAEDNGEVVGHILFSPLRLKPEPVRPPRLAALAPMAVKPEYQRKGVGDALARNSLELLRESRWDGVIVLGHPKYYPRFGFVPASGYGIAFPGEVPDEAFLALELLENGLNGCRGTVVYHPAFGLG